MSLSCWSLVVALALAPSLALADATIPTKDVAGARDTPLLKRYEGSFIVSYDRVSFTDFRLPLSKLEATDERDPSNNVAFRPKEEKELEGARTRLVYLLPAQRSPLEVLRNYQDEIEGAGGSVLFACKAETCGGDHTRSSGGGGGESSLSMYFVRESDLKDESFSNGACAQTSAISDQRYVSARMPHPDGEAHVAVQTYQVNDTLYCKAFSGRTVAVVHVVEPRARDRKMTTVKADEMARTIGMSGRIALYGIPVRHREDRPQAGIGTDAAGDRRTAPDRAETRRHRGRPYRQPGCLRFQPRPVPAQGGCRDQGADDRPQDRSETLEGGRRRHGGADGQQRFRGRPRQEPARRVGQAELSCGRDSRTPCVEL